MLCDEKNAGPLMGTGLAKNLFFYQKRPLQILRLVRMLRKNNYDYVVNLVLYPSFTFGILARLIAPNAIRAAGNQDRYSYFYNRIVKLPELQSTHILQTHFRIAADLAGETTPELSAPWVAYSSEIKAEAEKLFQSACAALPQGGKGEFKKIVLINLSAGIERREWPVEKYAAFLHAAIEEDEFGIDGWFIITDPAKPGQAAKLVEIIKDSRVVQLPFVTDFRVMMEFLHFAHILITPDTALSHAASAMGTPVLDLIIGENEAKWAPYGVPHKMAISEDAKDIRELPVENVLSGFKELSADLRNQNKASMQ